MRLLRRLPCGITIYEKISPNVKDDLLDNLKCIMALFHGASTLLVMTGRLLYVTSTGEESRSS